MGFTCPDCQNTNSLTIAKALKLPPDGRSDEITLPCPNPGDTNCTCQTHIALKKVDEFGAWVKPFDPQASFQMVWDTGSISISPLATNEGFA